jgi:hypothetical protein
MTAKPCLIFKNAYFLHLRGSAICGGCIFDYIQRELRSNAGNRRQGREQRAREDAESEDEQQQRTFQDIIDFEPPSPNVFRDLVEIDKKLKSFSLSTMSNQRDLLQHFASEHKLFHEAATTSNCSSLDQRLKGIQSKVEQEHKKQRNQNQHLKSVKEETTRRFTKSRIDDVEKSKPVFALILQLCAKWLKFVNQQSWANSVGELTPEQKKKTIIELFADHGIPLAAVEHQGFQKLTGTIFKAETISKAAKDYASEIRKELFEKMTGKHVVLQIDIGTVNSRFVVLLGYIVESQQIVLIKCASDAEVDPNAEVENRAGKFTRDNLIGFLRPVVDELRRAHAIIVHGVSDNASNFSGLFDDLGVADIRCFAHVTQLVLGDVLASASKDMKWIHETIETTAKFATDAEAYEKKVPKTHREAAGAAVIAAFEKYAATRWSSRIRWLESIEKRADVYAGESAKSADVAMIMNNGGVEPTATFRLNLSAAIRMLKPFQIATDEIQRKGSTVMDGVEAVARMMASYRAKNFQGESKAREKSAAKAILEIIYERVKGRWNDNTNQLDASYNCVPLQIIAFFSFVTKQEDILQDRSNAWKTFGSNIKTAAVSKMYERIVKIVPPSSAQLLAASCPPARPREISNFKKDVLNGINQDDHDSNQSYLRSLLNKLANTSCCSEADVERFFSAMSASFCSDLRNRMKPDTLSALTAVKVCRKNIEQIAGPNVVDVDAGTAIAVAAAVDVDADDSDDCNDGDDSGGRDEEDDEDDSTNNNNRFEIGPELTKFLRLIVQGEVENVHRRMLDGPRNGQRCMICNQNAPGQKFECTCGNFVHQGCVQKTYAMSYDDMLRRLIEFTCGVNGCSRPPFEL